MQYSEVSHVYRLRVVSELELFGVRRKKEEWQEERKGKEKEGTGRGREANRARNGTEETEGEEE